MAVILILFLTAPLPANAQEVLENYDVTIKINQDSSLFVIENITAKVENINISRGIIRSFPVEYQDKNGKTVYVTWDVETVLLDNAPVEWSVSKNGRYKDLRIGNPNRIISPGLHTFTIKYSSTKQLGFYENHDELYWNVTGNQWAFPIVNASCIVALPNRDFGVGFNSVEWYVGEYGEKGQKDDAVLKQSNKVSTTRTLATGEGLTVVYTWPKGLVTPPPPPAEDNQTAHGIIGFITLLLMIIWFAYARTRWGKDAPRKAVIPLFSPPNNESPAYMRFARDIAVDKTAFTAAILNLAVKGAIRIEEEEGRKSLFGKQQGVFVLHKTGAAVRNLQTEEDKIMMNLFPGVVESVVLDGNNANYVMSSMSSLSRHLNIKSSKIFQSNIDKCLIGVLIYFIGLALLYPFSGEEPLNLIASGFTGIFIIITALPVGRKKYSSFFRNIVRILTRLIIPVTIGVLAVGALSSMGKSTHTAVFFILAAAVFSVMRPFMSARTVEGYDALNSADGLALYMDTAEKERLEMFNPPEETPELFEKLMPYALALDVAKTWGNRFEKILAAEKYQPTWYVGPHPYMFLSSGGFNSFSSNLASQVSSSMISQTTTAAPGSSSGFGGGGFSGGGGGGGGGGGW